MPAPQVNPPQSRKSVIQGYRGREEFLPIPYISRQPMTCAMPFMETQSLSERLYQLFYSHMPDQVLTLYV
jgi:hypothetical protein